MNKPKLRIIYCDEEINDLIDDNFSKGKWGYQKFSKVMCKMLKDYLKNKPTLEKLQNMEQELITKMEESKIELQDIQMQKELLLEERENKLVITEMEAAFLNGTKKIIDEDYNRLKPRLRVFNNKFKKEVNEEEFIQLIKKAGEEFPNSQEYIVEI